MGILLGIVSFFTGLAVNAIDYVARVLYEPFGYELATFERFFPAAAPFRDMFVYLGYGIMMLIFVFQLLKNFGIPIGIQAEDPIKLTFKIGLFWGLIIYSKDILDELLAMFTTPLDIFTNTDLPFSTMDVMDIVLGILRAATGIGAIVEIILTLVLAWQFIKLLLETIERYIVLCFVVYAAPIALAVGPFESTNQIFKSWCRLLASQMLLILLNVWSIRLFSSFFAYGLSSYSGAEFIIAFLVGMAFLKFAQKIDTLLRIVGLNTASTGGGLGSSIGGLVATTMAMTRMTKGAFKPGKDSGKTGSEARTKNNASNGESNVRMSGSGTNNPASGSGSAGGGMGSGLSKAQNSAVSAMRGGYQDAAASHSTYATNAAMAKNSSDIVNASEAHIQGNDANAVAGSLFTPADGFEQTPLKMDNGDEGFLYKNPDTGEAYAVSFNTAGDGIVTGEMGAYDMQTGGVGEMTPFTIASQDMASSLGVMPENTDFVQGGDGNAYVPTQNLNGGQTPFKMSLSANENSTQAKAPTGESSTQQPATGTASTQSVSQTTAAGRAISMGTGSSSHGSSFVQSSNQSSTQAVDNTASGQASSSSVGVTNQSANVQSNQSAQMNASVTQSVQMQGAAVSENQSSAPIQQPEPQGIHKQKANEQTEQPITAKEESFVGRTARMEPANPPIPTNMQGKTENISRPNLNDPASSPIEDIGAPAEEKKLSFGDKTHNFIARIKDIFN